MDAFIEVNHFGMGFVDVTYMTRFGICNVTDYKYKIILIKLRMQ